MFRIRNCLWRQGNLSLQDYLLLRLDPELVRILQVAFCLENLSGRIDDLLDVLLRKFELAKQNPFKSNTNYIIYAEHCFIHDTWQDLSFDAEHPSMLEHFRIRSIIDCPEAFPTLLRYGSPTTRDLHQALQYQRHELVELMISPPYNLIPDNIHSVVLSRRVEYLDRFNLRGELLEHLYNSVGDSSPEIFHLWFENCRIELDSNEMDGVLKTALQKENVPLLRHIAYNLPGGWKAIADTRLEDSATMPKMDTIIFRGNEELIQIYFYCLKQWQLARLGIGNPNYVS